MQAVDPATAVWRELVLGPVPVRFPAISLVQEAADAPATEICQAVLVTVIVPADQATETDQDDPAKEIGLAGREAAAIVPAVEVIAPAAVEEVARQEEGAIDPIDQTIAQEFPATMAGRIDLAVQAGTTTFTIVPVGRTSTTARSTTSTTTGTRSSIVRGATGIALDPIG